MKNSSEHSELLRRGQKVAFTATLIIFLLAVAKYSIGHLFQSQILIADAYHSAVDVLAVFASWFGLRLAARKKSTRFPYGLYKAENFVTFVIGALITWAGIENLLEGYNKLFLPPANNDFPVLPVIVSAISMIVSYFVARIERQTGTFINSGALQANASEAFLDVGTSAVVLGGILLTYAKIPFIEGSIVMFIALLIIRLGIMNIWTPMLILMDANLNPKLQAEIEEKISRIKGVKNINDVKIRQSGPFKMVECKIATRPSISVFKAHELTNMIENHVDEQYSDIESVFVHIEPMRQLTLSAIIPVNDISSMDSKVYGHFGRAPYFMILKLNEKGGTEIEDFYYNEFLGERDRIHIAVKVINAIIKHDMDIVFAPKIGEIAFHMLKDNFVDIFKADEGLTVQEVVRRYVDGDLEEIIAPHPAEESEIWHIREDS